MTQPRKKLIEVALPLEAINKESAREKSIRHGHPSTLHLWWSRKPLATARAVLFAQMVDDPASCPDEFPTEAAQEAERQRLFDIIEDLVKWENSTNDAVLHAARTEIARSTARAHGVSVPRRMTPEEVADALRQYAPPVLDPFAGGGSIPLEAQRLGLEAHASDLNPVAVLITKALIEIPPVFANRPPVNPKSSQTLLQREWRGAQGLAEDVIYYGNWMREEAWKRIGHLYPKAKLSKEQGGGEVTVIAWLWVRTVKCPNPACGAQMPLVSKFWLSSKKGKEVWAEPVVDHTAKEVHFRIRQGIGAPAGTVNRGVARCLVCDQNTPASYVRAEADAKRMTAIPLAVVVEGNREQGRFYCAPTDKDAKMWTSALTMLNQMQDAHQGPLSLVPDEPCRGTFASNAQGARYGFFVFGDYFTPRQLVALTTFSNLVSEVRERVVADALRSGFEEGDLPLNAGGTGSRAYADAIATYLALAVDKMLDTNTSLCTWQIDPPRLRSTFSRQGLLMSWDIAEANIFGDAAGDYQRCCKSLCEALDRLVINTHGRAKQLDATVSINSIKTPLISTDPPYYDNVS